MLQSHTNNGITSAFPEVGLSVKHAMHSGNLVCFPFPIWSLALVLVGLVGIHLTIPRAPVWWHPTPFLTSALAGTLFASRWNLSYVLGLVFAAIYAYLTATAFSVGVVKFGLLRDPNIYATSRCGLLLFAIVYAFREELLAKLRNATESRGSGSAARMRRFLAGNLFRNISRATIYGPPTVGGVLVLVGFAYGSGLFDLISSIFMAAEILMKMIKPVAWVLCCYPFVRPVVIWMRTKGPHSGSADGSDNNAKES